MAKITRNGSDPKTHEIQAALEAYESAYHGSSADLYRQNRGSIRIRITDRRFEGMTKSRRHDFVWEHLKNHLDEDTVQEISVLLLLAPTELRDSLANLDFEQPLTSKL